eukprot:SAG11_NODE_204_length_12459_cov_6.526133_12_plen_165_part_00
MAYLHGRPIPMLHRDLKSPNLLLVEPPVVQQVRGSLRNRDTRARLRRQPPSCPDYQGHDVDFVPCLKITDFGMAREKEMQLAETIRTLKQAQTQLMTGCGTLYWMSPELCAALRARCNCTPTLRSYPLRPDGACHTRVRHLIKARAADRFARWQTRGQEVQRVG